MSPLLQNDAVWYRGSKYGAAIKKPGKAMGLSGLVLDPSCGRLSVCEQTDKGRSAEISE
jgi:hypothetical protein